MSGAYKVKNSSEELSGSASHARGNGTRDDLCENNNNGTVSRFSTILYYANAFREDGKNKRDIVVLSNWEQVKCAGCVTSPGY